MDYLKQQNDLITKQFAGMRSAAAAQKDEAQRQNKLNLMRNANASGGFGGAEQKMQDESNLALNKAFEEGDANLGVQEAQTRMGVAEAERGRKFQGEQQALQLKQQGEQFKASLAQAGEFFNKEFGENQKTNLINAMNAMKDKGWFDADTGDWAGFFSSNLGTTWEGLYGNKQMPVGGFVRG